MTRYRIMWIFPIVLLCLTVGLESPVQAATPRGETALDSGPIVRRQLLHRSTRLEIAPLVGFTVNDAFVRNTLVGANVNYHLNNSFGLGLTANYGALQMDTSLRESVHETLSNQDQNHLNRLSYSYINWGVDLTLSYVPIFGKFTIMNSMIVHYDLHLLGGLGAISEDVVAATEGGAIDPGLSGTRPSGVVGAGFRFFVSDRISINYQIRDYIYSRAQVSNGAANPQLSNNIVMSLGIGIFLPGDVKISR